MGLACKLLNEGEGGGGVKMAARHYVQAFLPGIQLRL